MSRTNKPRIVEMPTLDEDREINEAAASDPDALPMTAQELAQLKPLSSVKGRPRSDNPKLLISIRYSPEVVAFFKGSGEGWQTRMDDVLKAYVREQSTIVR